MLVSQTLSAAEEEQSVNCVRDSKLKVIRKVETGHIEAISKTLKTNQQYL